MEPGKLEDQMRDRLEERQLQPSQDAWERLESRLGKQDGNSRSRVLWYTMAAVFAGVVILLTVFNTSVTSDGPSLVEDTPGDQNPAPVVESSVPAGETSVKDALSNSTPEVDPVETKAVKGLRVEKQRTPIAQSPSNLSSERENAKKRTTELSATLAVNRQKTHTEPQEVPSGHKELQPPPNKLLESKVSEVVAQIERLDTSKGQNVADEVDRLLREAQTSLIADQEGTGGRKVDPASLLFEVESDLERNFREKVFEVLGKGFEKIRTAVAERNY